MKFITQLQAMAKPHAKIEDSSDELLVVEDQSMSVAEILRRFVKGQVPPISKDPYYEENPDIDNPLPDLSLLDFDEIVSLRDSLTERINSLRSDLQSEAQASASENPPTDTPADSDARTN